MEHIASAVVALTCAMSTSRKTFHLLTLLIQHLSVSQTFQSLPFVLEKDSPKILLCTIKCEIYDISNHMQQKQQTEQRFSTWTLTHLYMPQCSAKNELSAYKRGFCIGNCWMLIFSKIVSNLVCLGVWMPNFINMWGYSEGFWCLLKTGQEVH